MSSQMAGAVPAEVLDVEKADRNEEVSCTIKVRKPFATLSSVALACVSLVVCVFLVTSRTQVQTVVTHESAEGVDAMSQVRALRAQLADMQASTNEDRRMQNRLLQKIVLDQEIPQTRINEERKMKAAGPTKKDSKINTINFEETFNPTPEGPKDGFGTPKHTSGTKDSSKRALTKNSKVNTINFEETFNPTPEGPEGGFGTKKTSKPSSKSSKVKSGDHTKKDKGDYKKKNHSDKEDEADTINEEESFAPTPSLKISQTYAPTPESLNPKTAPPKHRTLSKGFKFAPGKETHAPTPENLSKKSSKSKSGKRGLQTDTINYVESFAPTPENYPTPLQNVGKRGLKKGYVFPPGKETYAPTPEGFGKTKKPTEKRKRSLQTDTINYVESFAPTPENYPGRKLGFKFAPGKETYAPTPEGFGKTKKPTEKRKRSLQTDTINYVESFAPTPENYPGRKLGFKFAPGKETYAPTPENLSKKSSKSGKRGLQVDTINMEESFAPTPENYPEGKRGLQTDAINYVESFAPTPENYPDRKLVRSDKASGKTQQ